MQIKKKINGIFLAIVFGFSCSLILNLKALLGVLETISANRYFQYRMFGLIAETFLLFCSTFLIHTVIISFLFYLPLYFIKPMLQNRFNTPVVRLFSRLTSLMIVSILFLAVSSAGIIEQKSRDNRPNVILIAVDTLRADHLRSYGYSRETSPEIDRFSRQSVTFTDCISHFPATTPSFASILTAKFPYHHGVLDNNYKGYKLDKSHMTVSEILKNSGYRTAAFIGGWTLKINSNLNQGFDEYFDYLGGDGISKKGKTLVEESVAWIEQNHEEKFFLFLHLFDPHGKYTPPPRYHLTYDATDAATDLDKIPEHQRHGKISDPSFYISRYDGEITYADYYLGRVFTKLLEHGLMNNTIIIFTADHGEEMADRNQWFNHGCYLYDEQIRVPLMIYYPDKLPPRVYPDTVRLIDVVPTLLDLLNIDFTSDLDGSSVLPGLLGNSLLERLAFFESGNEKNLWDQRMPGLEGKQYGVRTRDWKLIRTVTHSGIDYEFFNLKQNPDERINIYGQGIGDEVFLKEKLEEFVSLSQNSPYYLQKVKKNYKDDLTEEDMAVLRAIGYIR